MTAYVKAFRFCCLLLATMCVFFWSKPAEASFLLFEALMYSNKPDLTQYGLNRIRMMYPSELWAAGDNQKYVNPTKVITAAQVTAENSYACIDIENWPITGKPADVTNSIDKYRQVADLVKTAKPSLKIGYFGVLPNRDFWRAIGGRGQKQYDQWLRENQKLKPISEKVDVVYPDLYTFTADKQQWLKYALANIKEARKYNKPVIAFIWPMYHDSTPLKGQFIPADFWEMELETCAKYADGIVIWGGWLNNARMNWEESAAWWIQTKKFLAAQGVSSP